MRSWKKLGKGEVKELKNGVKEKVEKWI